MQFSVPLKEPRVKPHQVLALHLMAAVAFLMVGILLWGVSGYIKSGHNNLKLYGGFLAILGFLTTVCILFRSKLFFNPAFNRVFRIIEFLVAAAISLGAATEKLYVPSVMFGIISATALFALYWESTKHKTLHIQVGTEGITLPASARNKLISWPDTEKVILRYGTLTIDCLDNRLYQWTVADVNFDTDSFEAFCNAQIESGKSARDTNNW
jgi:hypothetical protein